MGPYLDQFSIHPEEMHEMCADKGPKIPSFCYDHISTLTRSAHM